MKDKIFILNETGSLSELTESGYDSEELLQSLLEKYPSLLAGGQIDEIQPRRWILISREIGIPDDSEKGNRWAVDHLFIDQEGIPTLVEVKRSSDTRIRREVIGQIMDYAANAVSYWSVEKLMSIYEKSCEENQEDSSDNINELVEGTLDYEEYWELVSTNLKAGKIRMIIVADNIPKELKNIIEFLNSQMSPAEILGLEIKQYRNETMKTLVPKVLGKSVKSDASKRIRSSVSTEISEDEYWRVFQVHSGKALLQIGQRIIDGIKDYKDYYWFGGSGIVSGYGHSMVPVKKANFPNSNRINIYPIALWTNGSVEISLQYFKGRGHFDLEENQKELIDRLNEIEGVDIGYEKIFKRPSINLGLFSEPNVLAKFIELIRWVFEKSMEKKER
ncbi:MAG: hypothetical protein R8P61_37095 [Bacteroidia bacterium]|nr:hypothetical protein [Bacteroidia bacterium]